MLTLGGSVAQRWALVCAICGVSFVALVGVGCSFISVSSPPRNVRPDHPVTCSAGAPVVDTVFAGGAIALAIAAQTHDCLNSDQDCRLGMLAGTVLAIAFAVPYTFSATYGWLAEPRCEEWNEKYYLEPLNPPPAVAAPKAGEPCRAVQGPSGITAWNCDGGLRCVDGRCAVDVRP